jgi:hypothetical protein
VAQAARLLLPVAPVVPIAAGTGLDQAIPQLLLDPAYHLK